LAFSTDTAQWANKQFGYAELGDETLVLLGEPEIIANPTYKLIQCTSQNKPFSRLNV